MTLVRYVPQFILSPINGLLFKILLVKLIDVGIYVGVDVSGCIFGNPQPAASTDGECHLQNINVLHDLGVVCAQMSLVNNSDF